MIDIAKHISKLVREHELVIIPGLGGFLTVSHPALVHQISSRITPPGRSIAFNTQIKDNDGFLAHSISKVTSLNYKESLGLVETFSTFCQEELQNGGRILFENLGILSINKSGHLAFLPDLSLNYDDNYFGLPDIVVIPIQRTHVYEPVISINPKAKKAIVGYYPRMRRVAAIAIPLFTVGVLGWLVHEPISDYFYKQSASIFKTSSVIPSQPVIENPTSPVDSAITTNESVTTDNSILVMDSQIVKEESGPALNGNYHIIAGAFSNENFAMNFINQLHNDGFNAYLAGQNSRGLYRVSIGNFTDYDMAAQQLKWYQANKNNSAWLLNEEL